VCCAGATGGGAVELVNPTEQPEARSERERANEKQATDARKWRRSIEARATCQAQFSIERGTRRAMKDGNPTGNQSHWVPFRLHDLWRQGQFNCERGAWRGFVSLVLHPNGMKGERIARGGLHKAKADPSSRFKASGRKERAPPRMTRLKVVMTRCREPGIRNGRGRRVARRSPSPP
jgi:hypothetical protein